MTDQRGIPVTLEEMTRRRDGWRQQCRQVNVALRAALARERALERQLREAQGLADTQTWVAERVGRQSAASAGEAQRFARECGRLRDELAGAREEIEDARDLALCLKSILRQLPSTLESLDPELAWENLPDWFTGNDQGVEFWRGPDAES